MGEKEAGVAGMGVDSLNQKITLSHLSSMILLFRLPAEDVSLLAMQVKQCQTQSEGCSVAVIPSETPQLG